MKAIKLPQQIVNVLTVENSVCPLNEDIKNSRLRVGKEYQLKGTAIKVRVTQDCPYNLRRID